LPGAWLIGRQLPTSISVLGRLGSQVVVQGDQLTDSSGWDSLEKATQGGLIGETSQAQEGKKSSVVLQNLGFVDASQASHDGAQKSENEVGGMITGTGARDSYPSLQQTAQAQLAAKTLRQYHYPEVG